MLNSIVDKIQETLWKDLLLSALLPLLLFLFINSGLLCLISIAFRRQLMGLFRSDLDLSTATTAIMTFTILLTLAALLFRTTLPLQKDLLEGKRWPFFLTFLTRSGIARQTARWEALDAERKACDDVRFLYGESEQWPAELVAVREKTKKVVDQLPRAGKEQVRSGRRWFHLRPVCSAAAAASTNVARLDKKRRNGCEIQAGELNRAFASLREGFADLATEVATNAGPTWWKDEASEVLANAQTRFVSSILDYAHLKARERAAEIFMRRQFSFPREDAGTLRPTAFGNIGASIRSYGYSRYGLNVDTVWARLRQVLKGSNSLEVAQRAKADVDFTVALLWLATISTAFWLVFLAATAFQLKTYLAVAVLGPLMIWGLYRLALENYRVFADIMRSTLDLYRFDLLKGLKLPLPTSTRQEQEVWKAIDRQLSLGEDASFTLHHGADDE